MNPPPEVLSSCCMRARGQTKPAYKCLQLSILSALRSLISATAVVFIAATDVAFWLVSFCDTAYWPLTVCEGSRPNFMAESKKFALCTASRLALRPIQPPVKSHRGLFPEVKGQTVNSHSFSPLPRYTTHAALYLYSHTHFLLFCAWAQKHISHSYMGGSGDRGSTVGRVLCYKSKGRWFDSRW